MSPNKNKSQDLANRDEFALNNLLEIFDSKIRFRILQLLFVYGELSLTDLSTYMNKSKPALYHHLQKMINLKAIKVSKEEQVRGSIMAKHYCLDEQTALNFQLISEKEINKIIDPRKRLKALENIIGSYRYSISIFRKKLDMLDLYTDFLEEQLQSREDSDLFKLDFNHLISDFNIGFHAQYLTEKQYTKFLEYYQEFYSKIREIIINYDSKDSRKNGKIVERPYFVTMVVMPMKKLLELELERMKA
ncbi:MAG: winged helix-turn-helix domain-containing protein [Candidatus Thorarchaeota archaeon]